MSTYNGWTIQTMPTTPAAPAGLEWRDNPLVAVTTSVFTGQQQVNDWNAAYLEGSVSMAKMDSATAQPWVAFLRSLRGPACVFQFPSALCAKYPAELTTDGGTTARYWRLKSNPHWTVALGSIYAVTFEIREAI